MVVFDKVQIVCYAGWFSGLKSNLVRLHLPTDNLILSVRLGGAS